MSRPTFKLAEPGGAEPQPGPGPPELSRQQLWFSLQRFDWSSVVLLPADPDTSAFELARALHEVGRLTMGERLRLLDGRGLEISATAPMILDMSGAGPVRPAGIEWSEKVLVVVDSVVSNPSSIPIALAADAVVLCLALGKTSLAAARETMKLVGPQRFIGCITVP